MKRIFILLILSLTIQSSFGQACGIYRIKYVGEITTESTSIKEIRLPTIMMLHNVVDKNSELATIGIELANNKINKEIKSHLTSHLFNNAQNLVDYYKSKMSKFPVTLVLEKGEFIFFKKIQIAWENIEIKILDDNGFGNLFEVNLNKIKW